LPGLGLWQTILLQGVIPVVVVGVMLPIGFVGFFLAIWEAPISDAVGHGELFLSAANASFIGCLVLIVSRTDSLVNVLIASFFALLLIMLPAFGLWAALTVQSLLDKEYSEQLAILGGGAYALIATVVALVFVWLSYRPSITLDMDSK
jgi:hypothetical protein